MTLPRWTLGLAGLVVALNASLLAPGWPDWIAATELRFDRVAAEPWRIWTGNLVHISAAHLWLDLFGLVVLGALSERALGWRWPATIAVAGLAVGLVVCWRPGELSYYRGLSGINHAAFFVALLTRRGRWVVPLGLALALAVGSELVLGIAPIGSTDVAQYGQPVPLAHVAGAVVGVVVGISCRQRSARTRCRRCR